MNGAHIHLLLNHVPIMGSLFALCLLLLGIAAKSEPVKKAALLALVVTCIVGIPAYLSGEEAEDTIENVVGANREAMHHHEDKAEIAFWVMMMSGAIALGTLAAAGKTKPLSNVLVWVNFGLMLVVFVLMARTGYSGGFIRHSEINMPAAEHTEKEHHR